VGKMGVEHHGQQHRAFLVRHRAVWQPYRPAAGISPTGQGQVTCPLPHPP
jgi:hypothetical protein